MQELGISSLAHFQLRLCIPRGGKIHYHYTNMYSYSFKPLLASSSSDQCALNNDGDEPKLPWQWQHQLGMRLGKLM